MSDTEASADLIKRQRAVIEALTHKLNQYRRLVIDADNVARKRGDRFGLCDSIDNTGAPYPSQWGADLIREARAKVTP